MFSRAARYACESDVTDPPTQSGARRHRYSAILWRYRSRARVSTAQGGGPKLVADASE